MPKFAVRYDFVDKSVAITTEIESPSRQKAVEIADFQIHEKSLMIHTENQSILIPVSQIARVTISEVTPEAPQPPQLPHALQSNPREGEYGLD